MDNEKINYHVKKQLRQTAGGIAEASGGYYQSKVAAWVAVNILKGSKFVNLWDLPISIILDRVECQVRQPVDDIMITTSDQGYLFIQCKNRLVFGESPDSEVSSVLGQFVRQFLKSNETRNNKSDVGLDSRPGRTLEYGRDRLILVTTSGSSSKVKETLPKILLRVRSSIEGDPLENIALNKDEEDILKILCRHINLAWEKYESRNPSNEEIRALLKFCWVQILDIDQGSSSEREARELLRSITLSPEHAENAWNILLNHFACCHENAIGATRSQLEDLLSIKNNIPLNLRGQEFVSHWTFQKGDMPKFRVERKKEIKEIMKWIEADDEDSNNSTHLVIHGMGGVGKSTLVAMTCELAYERLQCLYPDGVHWIKLGSHTSIWNSVHDFLAKLGEKAILQTRDGVRDYLEKYLRNRKLLLIIDDAWNAEDLEMFKFTGMSRAIITTRFKDFAGYFQWSPYELKAMSETEAIELLSKELDQKKVKSKKKILEKLAEAVDYLPLALHLLEPLLRDNPWEEILDELQHPIKRLELLEPEGDELGAKQSLVNTFLLSLDKIKPDLRTKFAWLGILADNTPINRTMAGTLWGDLSGPLINKKLRALEQQSLILYIGEGVYSDTFRLHKLIHDMARILLFRKDEAIDPSDRIKSMNLSLKEAHHILLERYRGKLKNKENGESWYNLPDDGYIHSNLFYHLEQAQQR